VGVQFNILDAKLPKQSWVKISQICTLSSARIGKKIGSVGPDELAQVIEGLNEIIGGKL
jgi:mRNA interferase MazF